ncbi:hypothetical protein VMCG_09702 [Cytospora schulzeri]|uniref:DUF7791 domain-containing protein n=1 Tax=Cytospora schulzeri TaxID=448051 RepID=A0A423VKB2_9PEZI|nr:hypothetical protein VMCG_09702 [Valsa malicola]
MAGTFLLALYISGPLAIEIYAFHDNEYQSDNYATEWPVKAHTEAKLHAVRSRILRRINARSQGLLEGKGGSVEFLYRTVRDFLRTSEMRQYLTSKLPAQFDPAFSLITAYLAMIKSTDFSNGTASIWDTSPMPVRREAPGDNRGFLIFA